MSRSGIRLFFLFLGDIIALYAALFITLAVRYGSNFYSAFGEHLAPFSIIFAIWLVVFYVSGLYDIRRLRNNLDFLKIICLTLFINAIIGIAFFYLIPVFGIRPKTNLFLFLGVFTAIEIFWRRLFNRLTVSSQSCVQVMLLGNSKSAEEISLFLGENKQLGYQLTSWLKDKRQFSSSSLKDWQEIMEKNKTDLIVVPPDLLKNRDLGKIFYHFLSSGINIKDLHDFYELIFRKIPLNDVSEEWFLENLTDHHRFYDDLKRAAEFLFALLLGIILLPLEILIGLLIKASSAGPAIYKQTRIGKNGREFILYKFRTMRTDAEKNGAEWAKTNDRRTTFIGKILRHSHLDELPQLINILRGNLSSIGPRPERPEFVNILNEEIPHYKMRHLIKPGVTGWAQINYRYGASIEDSFEKLQYDIYYLKNRSIILDLAIIIKTIKNLFVNQK